MGKGSGRASLRRAGPPVLSRGNTPGPWSGPGCGGPRAPFGQQAPEGRYPRSRGADDLAAVGAGHRAVEGDVDVGADELDVAVGEHEVEAVGVPAAEAEHVGPVARGELLPADL